MEWAGAEVAHMRMVHRDNKVIDDILAWETMVQDLADCASPDDEGTRDRMGIRCYMRGVPSCRPQIPMESPDDDGREILID
ncbi:hypothetical protein NDU88_000813 [Pleurodeles waltl]|uniref:Uncharacterized protein n=1 Tax=Pleurodeles waltl TaxID=8319 RepID=A0AAV7MJY9_PLEWA|nr:hypothetical protein NDU88_000813 [Pleurodeles waltl]